MSKPTLMPKPDIKFRLIRCLRVGQRKCARHNLEADTAVVDIILRRSPSSSPFPTAEGRLLWVYHSTGKFHVGLALHTVFSVAPDGSAFKTHGGNQCVRRRRTTILQAVQVFDDWVRSVKKI